MSKRQVGRARHWRHKVNQASMQSQTVSPGEAAPTVRIVEEQKVEPDAIQGIEVQALNVSPTLQPDDRLSPEQTIQLIEQGMRRLPTSRSVKLIPPGEEQVIARFFNPEEAMDWYPISADPSPDGPWEARCIFRKHDQVSWEIVSPEAMVECSQRYDPLILLDDAFVPGPSSEIWQQVEAMIRAGQEAYEQAGREACEARGRGNAGEEERTQSRSPGTIKEPNSDESDVMVTMLRDLQDWSSIAAQAHSDGCYDFQSAITVEAMNPDGHPEGANDAPLVCIDVTEALSDRMLTALTKIGFEYGLEVRKEAGSAGWFSFWPISRQPGPRSEKPDAGQ
jgi:hypothetical protein